MKQNHKSAKNRSFNSEALELSDAALDAEFEKMFGTPITMSTEERVVHLIVRIEETESELQSVFALYSDADVNRAKQLDESHTQLTSDLRQLRRRLAECQIQHQSRN